MINKTSETITSLRCSQLLLLSDKLLESHKKEKGTVKSHADIFKMVDFVKNLLYVAFSLSFYSEESQKTTGHSRFLIHQDIF